jgi:signal transduction histidine kinase
MFSLAFSLLTSSQDLDSMKALIENKPVLEQIQILNKLCYQLRVNNPQLGLKYGNAAIEIAEKTNQKKLLAESKNLIGVLSRNNGDYEAAMKYHLEALNLSNEFDNQIQKAFSFNNISVVFRQQSQYGNALKYAIKALEIFQDMKYDEGIGFTTLNIGTIFLGQNNFEKSLEYYNLSLKTREKQKHQEGIVRALDHIAELMVKTENFDDALKKYLEVEEDYHELKNNRGLAETWNGIAQIYFLKKDYATALKYRLKALEIFLDLSFIDDIILTRANIALLYGLLNDRTNGDRYINQSHDAVVHIQTSKITSTFYRIAADYYSTILEKDKALVYFNLYSKIIDSLNSKEITSILSNIEAINKAEKENDILQKDIEAGKNKLTFIIILAIMVLIIAIILLNRYLTLRSLNRKLKELNKTKDTFFKIIAHDLRSPFNAILGFLDILKMDYNELSDKERIHFINSTHDAAKQSYQLLENLLLWSKSSSGSIPFNFEIVKVNDLLDEVIISLKTIADFKNITLSSICPENIFMKADREMMKTVLRNIITNSIKFTNESGSISVEVKPGDKQVKIFIMDNGIGMTNEQVEQLFNLDKISNKGTNGEIGSGLGLIICKEIIKSHKGIIAASSKLGVGTEMIITIPV